MYRKRNILIFNQKAYRWNGEGVPSLRAWDLNQMHVGCLHRYILQQEYFYQQRNFWKHEYFWQQGYC